MKCEDFLERVLIIRQKHAMRFFSDDLHQAYCNDHVMSESGPNALFDQLERNTKSSAIWKILLCE